MGMKWTALAIDNGPAIRSQRLLLLALCDRADENGICWPSRADLRKRASMSDSTLTRCLRALEAMPEDGSGPWIQRQRRFNNSNVFRINVWKLQELEAKRRAERKATPEGFEPFAEEVAAQAIENKGSGHGEQGSGHGDRGSGHGDGLTGHPAAPNLSRTCQEPSAIGAAKPVLRDPALFAAYLAEKQPAETFEQWQGRMRPSWTRAA
jgi:hypothetical protein